MAYFNHAFQKTILAVDGMVAGDGTKMLWDVNDNAVASSGARLAKVAIVGTDGANKDKILAPSAGGDKVPFVIAGSTLRPVDKIGKFMGGFQSLNTSKKINPKFVDRIYIVKPQEAANAYVLVGATLVNGTPTLCTPKFDCGETYYLQLNVKGNVVASTLMHNYFNRIPAYISCCGVDTTTSTSVSPLSIYYEWAKYIKEDPLTEGIIEPMIVAGGQTYTKDGIKIEGAATKTFAELEVAMKGSGETPAVTTGYLKVIAAYEETKFGNCTWQKNEGYELQPLEIYASLVDKDGNPCFEKLCIEEVAGVQKTRTGESLLREVILDESYHQRPFHTDLRKREVEGDGNVLSMIDRNAQYPGIYLLHSIPRKQNPSSTFDNDQYLIQIVTTGEINVTAGEGGAQTVTMTGNLNTIATALQNATGITPEIFLK